MQGRKQPCKLQRSHMRSLTETETPNFVFFSLFFVSMGNLLRFSLPSHYSEEINNVNFAMFEATENLLSTENEMFIYISLESTSSLCEFIS